MGLIAQAGVITSLARIRPGDPLKLSFYISQEFPPYIPLFTRRRNGTRLFLRSHAPKEENP
jgi:hypothetical protein